MLRTAHDMYGLRLLAQDGNIGHVDDIYFDDQAWVLRYLVANTGSWMIGRRVLIAPPALEGVEWWGVEGVRVALTKEQIEASPDVSTAEPVTREVERTYYEHYGFPLYWGGDVSGESLEIEMAEQQSHLQSCREVDSYHVHAIDGDIGHVTDLIFDEATWVIRYLVVDTRNWIPGRKVLITPDRVRRTHAADRRLDVALTREQIRNAPAYDHDEPIDDRYEAKLRAYYDDALRRLAT